LITPRPHSKVKTTAHYLVRFALDWYEITDALPSFMSPS
jgi:hypothetical protein